MSDTNEYDDRFKEEAVQMALETNVSAAVEDAAKIQTTEKNFYYDLIRKEKMLDALNSIAVAFLSQNNKSFSELMTEEVGVIADAADIDRLSIWRNYKNQDGLHASLIYRWEKKDNGATGAFDKFADIVYAGSIPSWEKLFMKNMAVNAPASEISSHEANAMQFVGKMSVFAAPIYISGSFFGFALFEDHRSEHSFPADCVELMRSAAFLFANAVLRAEMEHKIITALFEAQEANRAKNEFLSRMNHEMLTPMNAIMGMTKILKMSDIPRETKEKLDEIDKASHHLLKIVNNLLDISGKRNNSLALTEGAFSFKTMFQEVIGKMRGDVVKKHQTLDSYVDQSIPMILFGDETRLAQIINIILTNANKFTPEDGEIHISVHMQSNDADTVTLRIETIDNGIGIPKDKLDDIFGIFEMVNGGTAAEHGGAGLGLPLARYLIELMGGRIWVDSELDKGSKFTFTCKLFTSSRAVRFNKQSK